MTKSDFKWILLVAPVLMIGCQPSSDLASSEPEVRGCMDRDATNYNRSATVDDGSCEYNTVVTDYFCTMKDLAQLELGMSKSDVKNALGVFPAEILSAADGCEIHVYRARKVQQRIPVDDFEREQAYNGGVRMYGEEIVEYELYFKEGWLTNILSDHSKTMLPGDLAAYANQIGIICSDSEDYVVYVGCTDKRALNYQPDAELEDGSCIYRRGCTDKKASNYDATAIFDDGTCFYIGCADPFAVNYDARARHNAELCEYCPCDTEKYVYIKSNNPNCEEGCVRIPREDFEKGQCDWCDALESGKNTTIEVTVEGAKLNRNK